MNKPPLTLRARALRLLARREYSRHELVAKLSVHAQEGEDLEAVLDALQARGLISEERVVASVLYQRAPRLGTQRVLQELRRKGVDEERVRAAGAQLADSELERARSVWRQRFGRLPPAATPQERARQMRFLAARGFSGATALRVLRERGQGEDGWGGDGWELGGS